MLLLKPSQPIRDDGANSAANRVRGDGAALTRRKAFLCNKMETPGSFKHLLIPLRMDFQGNMFDE